MSTYLLVYCDLDSRPEDILAGRIYLGCGLKKKRISIISTGTVQH